KHGRRSWPTRAFAPRARCPSTANACSGVGSRRSSTRQKRPRSPTPDTQQQTNAGARMMTDVRTQEAPTTVTQGRSEDHGSYIWYELMTPDPDAAKAFYDAVVG